MSSSQLQPSAAVVTVSTAPVAVIIPVIIAVVVPVTPTVVIAAAATLVAVFIPVVVTVIIAVTASVIVAVSTTPVIPIIVAVSASVTTVIGGFPASVIIAPATAVFVIVTAAASTSWSTTSEALFPACEVHLATLRAIPVALSPLNTTPGPTTSATVDNRPLHAARSTPPEFGVVDGHALPAEIFTNAISRVKVSIPSALLPFIDQALDAFPLATTAAALTERRA
mmetsp:Transcript_38855/g.77066  ORF Transcript_38855/g.77066 Transcript_38855/m.77066 type:complete len:225 (+) Transcript_38855:109-783(+)|eukprot:CAMPEP_0172675210 /NCGR_PEP_ID=MMETSP1074-20121228/13145_1 /TAXON_ID=2916 /ORGANISM="Ceratium fusus, Strain PA161109" /LENGTH=224 /DNA_ID=CAMNT_0013492659 /DNA_START=84 /DNA_END=758 /DNA_ORIENTATION=-